MKKWAYYNESDLKAAAWLRELIKRDLIAPGEVDERSIEDVTPIDVATFKQYHWFAGIGTWSYALRQAGWPDDRAVWTGSCPCQPFSSAGKGGGFDDERHLWPAWFWLISQCRPGVVFGEQVASRDGLAWLDLVCSDLEGAGYAIGAADLCAAGFGAPHIRQRLFFVAHTAQQQRQRFGSGRPDRRLEHSDGGGAGIVANASGATGQRDTGGFSEPQTKSSGGRIKYGDIERHRDGGAIGIVADAAGVGSAGDAGVLGRIQGKEGHEGNVAEHGGANDPLALSDSWERGRRASGEGCDGSGPQTGRQQGDGEFECCGEDGDLGDAERSGLAEQFGQRGVSSDADGADAGETPLRASAPVDDLDAFQRAIGTACNGHWRGADWVWCNDPDGPRWRPTEPGSFPLAHRPAARMVRLRGYGNAIVAPVATEFIRAYMETTTP